MATIKTCLFLFGWVIWSISLIQSENVNEDNHSIQVTWTVMLSDQTVPAHHAGTGMQQNTWDEMDKHYAAKMSDKVRELVSIQYAFDSSSLLIRNPDLLKKELLDRFVHHTVNAVNLDFQINDCGASVIEGKIHLRHCPGQLTVITLGYLMSYSCSMIEGLEVFGPVILVGQSCSQQLVSKTTCARAISQGYLQSGCKIVNPALHSSTLVVAILVMSLFCGIFFLSSVVCWFRLRKIIKTHQPSVNTRHRPQRTLSCIVGNVSPYINA